MTNRESAEPEQGPRAETAHLPNEASKSLDPEPENGPGAREEYRADPVTRMLLIGLLGVVVLFVVAIVSALAFGFLSPARAPRTLVERDLATYGEAVRTEKADAKTTASYAAALIDSGQMSEASALLVKALATARTDKSFLQVQQARLAYVQKQYDSAAKLGDVALVTADSELAGRIAELAKKGIKQKVESQRPLSWLPAARIKADALAATPDAARAIEAYDVYLKVSPGDSDVLVARGTQKVTTGDKAGAEKDFREALRFIPDFQPALEALKQIGATSK